MPFDVVVVAAGSSTRFGATDKLWADLRGRPVLAWSLAAIERTPGVGCLVVVTSPDRIMDVHHLCADWCSKTCFRVVEGGSRRRDSVEAGLRQCSSRYVAILDGARPMLTPELLACVADAATGNSGAIAATPVTDTIKEVRDGTIAAHPDRSRLWAAQTPQVVLRQAWLDAAAMGDNDETDDAAMLSRLGLECLIVDAGVGNLKITRPVDLEVAAAILGQRESDQ
ncbi:MAG: 2-C-methyl-D-erythritol 4-phosphate cytidylyltransferase [bacterium]